MEPLKKAVSSREALRAAVRSLLVRRAILPHELTALENAGLGTLDLSAAFTRVEAELALAALPNPAMGTPGGPSTKQLITPANGAMLRVAARAMGHVARNTAQLKNLVANETLTTTIGQAVARILAEECFPTISPPPDPNRILRQAAHELLAYRNVASDTLDELGSLDRSHLAGRLESKLDLMRAVVPPGRGEALEQVVRQAGLLLRRTPPVDVDTLNAAIAP